MTRICGINLNVKKHAWVSLTGIYGLGRSNSKVVCKKAGISQDVIFESLSDDQVDNVRKVINEEYMTEGDLRDEVIRNVKGLMAIGCYRGIRHRKSLPVRGQRTHSNARTRKGKAKPIANKKK